MGTLSVTSGHRELIIGASSVTRGFDFSEYREIQDGATISTAALTLSPSSGLTAGSAVITNDAVLWSGQTTNNTSSSVSLRKGLTPITLAGTMGTGTVTLQVSSDGGTTWDDLETYTSIGIRAISTPMSMLARLVLTGAGGGTSLTAVVELGNFVTFPLTPSTAGQYTATCAATLSTGTVIIQRGYFNVIA